jgi:hypothetical protein
MSGKFTLSQAIDFAQSKASRQTTLVTQFGNLFDQYLYFNLERATDRQLFNAVFL